MIEAPTALLSGWSTEPASSAPEAPWPPTTAASAQLADLETANERAAVVEGFHRVHARRAERIDDTRLALQAADEAGIREELHEVAGLGLGLEVVVVPAVILLRQRRIEAFGRVLLIVETVIGQAVADPRLVERLLVGEEGRERRAAIGDDRLVEAGEDLRRDIAGNGQAEAQLRTGAGRAVDVGRRFVDDVVVVVDARRHLEAHEVGRGEGEIEALAGLAGAQRGLHILATAEEVALGDRQLAQEARRTVVP